jgi:apolipoprotein N-acyltransferase
MNAKSLSPPARLPVLLAACLVAGALMACATPPMNVYPMAWLGMVGIAWLLDDPADAPQPKARWRRWFRGGLRGFVFAVGTNLVALRFIAGVITRFTGLPSFTGPLALLLLACFEASRWFLAAVARGWLVRLGVPKSVAFAFGVYIGTFMPTMIPWTVACGVCPWPATVQIAELVGERGVALLMAFEAALVMEALKAQLERAPRRLVVRPLAVSFGLLAATLLYGAVRIHQVDAERAAARKARVALVEPSITATERWDEASAKVILAELSDLTRRAEHDRADVVIWPEAAYPYAISHVSRRAPRGAVAILQPGVHGPVLTGLLMSGQRGKYNSAVVALRDGKLSDPYDKIHLLWFGETVPLEDKIPWLRDVFERGTGLIPGEHSVALEAGPVRAAILNCFEDILPDAGREAIAVNPNLLVNLTNDAWFQGSSESEVHFRLARLRAVELRRDLVRAVNYGPTAWVDAVGRIVDRYDGGPPGVLMTEPALLESSPTLFARLGDAPLLIVTLGVLVDAIRRRRRAKNEKAESGTKGDVASTATPNLDPDVKRE